MYSGPNMKWYTSSWLRPPNSSASVRVPRVGLEAVLLIDPHPRQLLALSRQLVAAPRQLLFGREQLQPFGEPFLSGPVLC